MKDGLRLHRVRSSWSRIAIEEQPFLIGMSGIPEGSTSSDQGFPSILGRVGVGPSTSSRLLVVGFALMDI